MQLISNSFWPGEAIPTTHALLQEEVEDRACPAGNRSAHLAWNGVQGVCIQNPTLLSCR